jgi:hypothetical protein
MNSFINVLLIVFTLPTMLLSIYVGFDLPVEFLRTTTAQLPYLEFGFLGLGLILLVISLRRSIRRWMGVRMTNQKGKYKWNSKVSAPRKIRVIVYTILESAVMASLGLAYFYLTPFSWFPSLVMLFFSLEGLIFLIVCHKNLFRIGITSKAILVADREVILIYLSGLRQVSISQQTVYFDYLENLQLTFPTDCVEENEREQFFNILKEQVNRDKVLFKNVD